MRFITVFFTVCAAILFTAIDCNCKTRSQEGKLLPVDDSHTDSSFLSFKTGLLDALKKQDVEVIKSVISEDVQIGFAPDDIGRQAFEQQWLVATAQSNFCSDLLRIISFGCAKETEDGIAYFVCPYVSSRFPEELDALGWVVVIGKDIPIYADSSTTSAVLGHLSFNLIPRTTDESTLWFDVPASETHAAGFIERRHVHGPTDYRVTFRKEQGTWVISSFLSGD